MAVLVPCAMLQGETVVNRKGEALGQLEQIMLDVPSGEIAYAVLARGGVLGLGAKLFAIPWPAFTLDVERQRLVLDIDPQHLEKAPGFDPDHWPAIPDPRWQPSERVCAEP
jgi:hypothetical protein